MLSILYDEYLKWGCPNCGCDAIKGSCVSGGGLTSGTLGTVKVGVRIPQSRQGFWMDKDAVPDSKHKVPEVKPRNFY